MFAGSLFLSGQMAAAEDERWNLKEKGTFKKRGVWDSGGRRQLVWLREKVLSVVPSLAQPHFLLGLSPLFSHVLMPSLSLSPFPTVVFPFSFLLPLLPVLCHCQESHHIHSPPPPPPLLTTRPYPLSLLATRDWKWDGAVRERIEG